MAYDILIDGALIVDGTGGKPYPGNVAVQDGRIVGVGPVSGPARRVLQAGGLAVAPGFWDVHTHYDAQVLWDPICTSSSWHGVTTVVMGNCGLSIAPSRPDGQKWAVRTLARVEGMNQEVLERTLPWAWGSFADYLDLLDRRAGVNAIVLAGHSAIRRYVMGPAASERLATEAEVGSMQQVLEECLQAGAAGFSTSRVATHVDGDSDPIPSRVAALEECFRLAEVLGRRRVGYVQLAVGSDFNKYSEEGRGRLSEMARRSRRPVCINSVSQTSQNPKGWKDTLDWMAKEEALGHRVFALGNIDTADFEFNLRFTNVFDRYPMWQRVLIAPMDQKVASLRDAKIRAQLLDEVEKNEDPFFKQNPIEWRNVSVTKVRRRELRSYEGRTLVEAGASMGRHPMDVMFDIALQDGLETQFRLLDTRNRDQEAQRTILTWPHILPEQSDAGAHTVTEVHTGFPAHLLGHWVRDRQALSLEDAVRRLTSLPAAEIGVTDRGVIREGQAADLVLFDPATIGTSPPTFVNDLPGGHRRLVQYPTGIEFVFVNGAVTVERGVGDPNQRNGSVLRIRGDGSRARQA